MIFNVNIYLVNIKDKNTKKEREKNMLYFLGKLVNKYEAPSVREKLEK